MRLGLALSLLSVVAGSHRGPRGTRSQDAVAARRLQPPTTMTGEDTGDTGGDVPASTGTVLRGCASRIAQEIVDAIPEATTLNPERCCSFTGPTAVFITHSERDLNTETGFEPFWNTIYMQIADTSEMFDVCFVMTGYDQTVATEKSLTEILFEINVFVSDLLDVPSMMSTDPTDGSILVNLFREITEDPDKPSIGVFNAGYENIRREMAVTGKPALPFVGYTDDALYGSEAAQITLQLLQGVPAKPLCFNGRPDLTFVGRRCAAYYVDVTPDPPSSLGGIMCREDSPVEPILSLILGMNANAVYSHVDCCVVVSQAVEMARAMNRTIVNGCQDETLGAPGVQFVTGQPIDLQANQASSWANLPVIESLAGVDGRMQEFFPSTRSLVNTQIFSELLIF